MRLLRATPTDTAVPSDTTALATAVTGPDGVFTLAAPEPGTYRARFGDAFFAPPLALANAETFDAREYALDMRTFARCDVRLSNLARDSVARAGGTLCELQVEKQAATVPHSLAAYYPEALKSIGGIGKVTAQFVVDTTGQADMRTWKVLASTHVLFSAAARDGVQKARFYPAEIGGRKVKQLVQLPFTFKLDGPPVVPPPMFPPPFRPLPRATGLP